MKISILMGIVIELLTKKMVTAGHLADKFEVSKRTIYRYIDKLCESGVPLISYAGRFGGIAVDQNFFIQNLFLTPAEIDELIVLCKNHTLLKQKLECFKEKFMNKQI